MSSDDRSPEQGGVGSRRRRLLGMGRRLIGRVRSGSKKTKIPAITSVQFIEASGREHPPVEVETGQTLLAIARAHGVDIPSYCGGQCSCSTCRVSIIGPDDGLTPRTPNECMVLGETQVRAGERLACQARLIGPVRVQLLDLY